MGNRITLVVAIVAAVFFASGEKAYSEMPQSVDVAGYRIVGGGSLKAVYRLRVVAGEQGAAFGFEYELPSWPSRDLTIGSPINITSVSLIGEGKMKPSEPRLQAPKPLSTNRSVCFRDRHSFIGSAYWVEVPPNTTAIVDLTGRPSYPYWPGTSYAVSFSTYDSNFGGAPRKALGTVVTLPLGQKGTRIKMRMKKGKHTGPRLVGSTQPPLRMSRIRLRAVASSSKLVGLGDWNGFPYTKKMPSVITDSEGHFSLASKYLPSRGGYTILARSEGTGGRVADWNCGPYVR